MKTDEIRRTFQEFFESRDHKRLPSAPLVPTAVRPVDAAHQRRDAPAEAVFPRPGAGCRTTASRPARSASGRSTSTTSARPTGTSRSSRCSATSRSATTSSRAPRSSPGSSRSRASGSNPTRSGRPSSRATTSSDSAPTRRRSRSGSASASPATGSCCSRAARTSGRRARPAPAGRAASSTSTAGSSSARRTTCRAARTSASWSTGTSCSCSTTRTPRTRSRRCRRNNIDTGLGLNRLAAIMQGTTSVFETDQIRPLIDLSEELSGKRYDETFEVDRAMRILADHSRGMSFLVADGVVPSNEERGYVLRRLMRRAIVQGRRLEIEPGFLVRYGDVVHELMAPAYPELHEHADTIRMWLAREEEQFGRTLEQGMRLLDDVIARAKDAGEEGIGADQAFLLHDTYGFPLELTLELAAEQGIGVDEQGFEELMDEQRRRARSPGRGAERQRPRADRRVRRHHRADHLHRLRDDRAGDRGRLDRAGERPRAGQARRVAVLRDRRRPGARRGRDRVRGRRLRGARARRRAGRRRPGARAGADQGRAARGRARHRARGSPRAA